MIDLHDANHSTANPSNAPCPISEARRIAARILAHAAGGAPPDPRDASTLLWVATCLDSSEKEARYQAKEVVRLHGVVANLQADLAAAHEEAIELARD